MLGVWDQNNAVRNRPPARKVETSNDANASQSDPSPQKYYKSHQTSLFKYITIWDQREHERNEPPIGRDGKESFSRFWAQKPVSVSELVIFIAKSDLPINFFPLFKYYIFFFSKYYYFLNQRIIKSSLNSEICELVTA